MSLPAVPNSSVTPGSTTMKMRSGGSSTRLPFPENTFAPLRLTAVQIHEYETRIQSLITKALHESERVEVMGAEIYEDPWELAGVSEGIQSFRKRDAHTPTRAQHRIIGNVSCDYRNMMEFHYAETSKELFEWLQFLYHHTVDAHVLQTMATGTPANPHHYFGIKWAVFQMHKFAYKTDQCFVEYMTYRKDLRGRDIGVRVTVPIQRADIDHTMDAMKVKRFSTQMVQIMRPVDHENKRATTALFVMADNEFPQAVPSTYTKTLTIMGQNMPLCIDSKRIARKGLVDERKWVANSARRSCVACTRSFGAARGRHHCRLCGDVICRKCMLLRDTAEYATDKVFKVVKTKFCVVCITNLRDEPASSTSTSAATSPSSEEEPRCAAPFNPMATKVRLLEYAPTNFEEDEDEDEENQFARSSVFSETESEDCRLETDFGESSNCNSARSSLSCLSEFDSENDAQQMQTSFAARRLQEIAELEESGIGRRPHTDSVDNLYDVADNLTLDATGGIAIIDTKDMIREPQYQSSYPAALGSLSSSSASTSVSGGGLDSSEGSPERRRSSQGRSLDQCLAEQEALLRQMVMAASQSGSQRGYTQPPQYYTEYDA